MAEQCRANTAISRMRIFFPQGNVSRYTLIILAACVWYGGSIVLLLKGGSLLLNAHGLVPDKEWPWLVALGGMALGCLKGLLFFSSSCRKNLERINALDEPKVWQFFRPGFFIFMFAMIMLGATLSRVAQDSYYFLLGVAFLDLSIAVALLFSSRIFWQQK